jgi:ABC-type transporter MlaC component
LTWRVSGQRISDVKVEGIWLALTLRSNFVQVLRDHDGDPQALIRYLGKS